MDTNKVIATWLLICCITIFAMVVLGGATRLTGSGLSMVEWEPIMGILPPLSQAEWLETFRLYQQSPEYIHKNFDMDVEGFKNIFWLEYIHRLLGRSIGVIFLIPMIFFIIKRKVSRQLTPKLITMFVLGGLQGLMGWYMVKSGLVNEPHVSHYRLSAHLGLAFVIYAYIFWVAMGLLYPTKSENRADSTTPLSQFSTAITALAFITVLSGGLVAGLKAGLIFNTFPLMGGSLIPEGLFGMEPVWLNFFENKIAVQFTHRLLAIIAFIAIVALFIKAGRSAISARARLGVRLLLGTAILQVSLGISTLLLHVPVALATIHQGGAVLLFTAALFVTHALRDQ
jgi:cytochrome c oxidase assembly protein subunit 15